MEIEVRVRGLSVDICNGSRRLLYVYRSWAPFRFSSGGCGLSIGISGKIFSVFIHIYMSVYVNVFAEGSRVNPKPPRDSNTP